MKFYLSSQGMGNQEQKLQNMTANGDKQVAFINNAMDFMTDSEEKKENDEYDVADLERLGFTVDIVDLKDYFHHPKDLEEKLETYDVIWVRGGNTFILAQAIKLSGFDEVVNKFYNNNKDMLYGGYSAGICMLGPTLEGLHLADDHTKKPYGDNNVSIWDGLNILDYTIVPHYQSDVPESAYIDETITYMEEHSIPYKTLKDGEVIVIE